MVKQSSTPQVDILIGYIASGKSTFSRQRAQEGAIIINDDSIVTALHAGMYGLYNKKSKPLYKIIENTILQTSLAMGYDVVVDRPNYSKAMRRRYVGIAKSMDAYVRFVVFPRASVEEHARRRAEGDNRGLGFDVWLKAAKYHQERWQRPEKAEGYDSIVYI